MRGFMFRSMLAAIAAYMSAGSALSLKGTPDLDNRFGNVMYGRSDLPGCGGSTVYFFTPTDAFIPNHCIEWNGKKASWFDVYIMNRDRMVTGVIRTTNLETNPKYSRYSGSEEKEYGTFNALPTRAKRDPDKQATLWRHVVQDVGVVRFSRPIVRSRDLPRLITDDPIFREEKTHSSANSIMEPGSTASINRKIEAFLAKYPDARFAVIAYGAKEYTEDPVTGTWTNIQYDQPGHPQYRRWGHVTLDPNRLVMTGGGGYGIVFRYEPNQGVYPCPASSGGELALIPSDGSSRITIGILQGALGKPVAVALPFVKAFVDNHRRNASVSRK